jgi:hypothetical protein
MGATAGAAFTNFDPFINAQGKLLNVNAVPGAIVMAPRTATSLALLKDGQGQPLVAPTGYASATKLTSNQIPVDLTHGTASNASVAFTGEWNNLLVGMRTGLTLEASRVAGADAFSKMLSRSGATCAPTSPLRARRTSAWSRASFRRPKFNLRTIVRRLWFKLDQKGGGCWPPGPLNLDNLTTFSRRLRGQRRTKELNTMGFFDIFRPKKRSFDTLAEFGLGLPTATGQTVTVDGSLALPAVFVCVRVLAESIGSMPLHIYRRASNGDREQATDHPLHRLFRFAPNTYQPSLEARECLTACVALRGNAYAFIERHDGVVAGVWPLHPARVQVIVDGTVIQYRYSDERAGPSFMTRRKSFTSRACPPMASWACRLSPRSRKPLALLRRLKSIKIVSSPTRPSFWCASTPPAAYA